MASSRVSPVQMKAWRSLLTAHAEIIERLGTELEADVDLPLSWYEVLLSLTEAEAEHLRMHELADSLLLSRSAATRFVDRMEKAGLVVRTSCPSDGRGTFVTLTAAGRETFGNAVPRHVQSISDHFARHLTDDESRQLTAVMERLASAVRDQD